VLLYWHALGNKVLTWLANVLNNLNLTDMETCYKAVRSDVLRHLRLQSDRFGIEPEITTRLAQWGARIYEVPISYHGRSYAEGKSIGWKDGVQAIWLLLKYRFLDTRFSEREGHSTLESLRTADSVNRWVIGQFKGFLGDRVLEAGAGIGNLTKHLIDRRSLVAVDLDPFYAEALERRYGHLENVAVLKGDLQEQALFEKLGESRFDTVLCVNVLEHLDEPQAALRGFHYVLQPGGYALLLVPAHAWLMSEADRALEHRNRYEVKELTWLLAGAGFDVVRAAEFNRLGVLGWWVNKVLGRAGVSRTQARLFTAMLPLARLVERIRPLPGLSVVAVGRRRAG
jgi:SAM-dependent methyltransferase